MSGLPAYVVPRVAELLEVDRSGCWVWHGPRSSSGYGLVERRRRRVRVHRYVYAMAGRVIPDGHDLDHECRNRLCANPDHVTPRPHDEHGALSRALAAGCEHDLTGPRARYLTGPHAGECRACHREARRNLDAWGATA